MVSFLFQPFEIFLELFVSAEQILGFVGDTEQTSFGELEFDASVFFAFHFVLQSNLDQGIPLRKIVCFFTLSLVAKDASGSLVSSSTAGAEDDDKDLAADLLALP